MRDRRSMNPKIRKKSVLWRHEVECHGGREFKFEMRVLEIFNRDPLGRQCMEGQLIREMDPDKLINNKEEWIQPGDIRAVFGNDGENNDGKRIGGEMMDKITKEILKIEREEKERMDEIMHGMAQNNDKKVKTQKRENGEGKGKEDSDVGDNGEEREEGKLEKVAFFRENY